VAGPWVSDVAVEGPSLLTSGAAWELRVGCIAGALEETEYIAKLRTAGFTDVEGRTLAVYRAEDALSFLTDQ
jgi:arsenite methyltransferase